MPCILSVCSALATLLCLLLNLEGYIREEEGRGGDVSG